MTALDQLLVEALGADLRSAGYTTDGVAELLGDDANAAMGRGVWWPALRATAGGGRLATLVRLFLLGTDEPADQVRAAFPSAGLAELAAAGVGAVLVPFPFAVDDHQTANGRFLAQGEAALVVPQAELDAERLATILRQLLGDRPRLLRMAEAARRLAKIDAAEQVAITCLEQARAGGRRLANDTQGR